MRIQHNIMAMGAYRNYTNNVNAMKKNLEKLSSGYKINRAGDDAAGLAISEKMRAQITGLETAQKNAKDGISLVQTAEGALTEVHDMLNRMVELATQSANGTYDNTTDRNQLQKELDQLRSEINRIADSSNFNGIKLLDGSLAAKSTTAAAIGDLTATGLLDGSDPSAAGAAKVTVTLGQGAGATDPVVGEKIAASTDATETFDGTDPINGTSASATFGVANTGTILGATAGTGTEKVTITPGTTKLEDLATATITAGGTKISDVYDISVATQDTKSTATLNVNNTAGTSKTTVAGVELNGTKTVDDLANAAALKDKYDVTVTGKGSFTATVDVTTAGAKTAINGTDLTGKAVGDLAALATDYDITVTRGGTALTTGALQDGDTITFTEKNASGKDTTAFTAAANALVTNGSVAATAGTAKTGATAITTGDKITITAKTAGADTTLSGADFIKNEATGTKTVADGKAAGTQSGWDSTYVIQAGDKITLTAKTPGADSNIATKAGTFISGAANTNAIKVNNGTNQGAAPAGEQANYKFTLDTNKLQGGQTIKFGAGEFTIDTTSAGTATTSTSAYIGGLSAENQVKEILKAIDLGNAGVFRDPTGATTPWNGTNNDYIKVTDLGNGKFEVALNAADGKNEAGNLGTFHVTTADGNNPISDVEYNKYIDPANATTDKIAQVTYKNDNLKAAALTAGSELKIGDNITIKIVATNADVKNANEISVATLTGSGGDAKLEQLIEQQAGFNIGQVDYDGSTGTLTFVTDQSGAGKLDALKNDTAVTVAIAGAAPSVDAKDGDKIKSEGDSGFEIEFGKTTLDNLKEQEVTLTTGETVKLGDVFNITSTGTGAAISAGDKLTFDAVQKGKLDKNLMDAVNFDPKSTTNTGNSGKVNTEIQEGWDEGETGTGQNTHYELKVDANKLAGGNSFTFGNVNGKSFTFDITYDDVATENGTATADGKEDVSKNTERVQVNLAASMTAEEKMEAIRTAVDEKMGGDFNVKVEGDTLTLDAKKGGDEYNLGNVRISSESGALTGKYTPYTSSNNGTEGTYARVSYDFDISKLKAGDSLTIGGKTIEVGEKAGTSDAGNKVITEADAQDAEKLAQAFESIGFQEGQIEFAGGKMTITGITTGQKAEDLAKSLGVKTATTRTDVTDGGLKLQIGDTADHYNQLIVSVKDMHVASLGLDNISIADQNSAATAIDAIKDAINQVSDVRGTLGATQNRLDHTINNLSVMTENIQDAESTIRDTDVAAEMMEYTKNNILIQSAQAMLAQANQVPQGVLQLLQ